MHWNGNKFFRRVVESHKSEYLHADNDRKIAIATRIIQIIRTQNPPGRFLKLDARTNKWNDIGNKKATRKIRQALREGTTNSVPSSVDSSYNGSQHRSIASSANSVNTDDIDNTTTMSGPNELEYNAQPAQDNMVIDDNKPIESSHTTAFESSFNLYNQTHDLFFIDESANLSDFDPNVVFNSEEGLMENLDA